MSERKEVTMVNKVLMNAAIALDGLCRQPYPDYKLRQRFRRIRRGLDAERDEVNELRREMQEELATERDADGRAARDADGRVILGVNQAKADARWEELLKGSTTVTIETIAPSDYDGVATITPDMEEALWEAGILQEEDDDGERPSEAPED